MSQVTPPSEVVRATGWVDRCGPVSVPTMTHAAGLAQSKALAVIGKGRAKTLGIRCQVLPPSVVDATVLSPVNAKQRLVVTHCRALTDGENRLPAMEKRDRTFHMRPPSSEARRVRLPP